MSATPFQAKGDEPEWRLIYDALLEDAEFGALVSYAALDGVLGRTFVDNRSPLYRARRELGDRRHRWLEAVPRKGYRVIEAHEHARVALGHKRKARHQFAMMVHVGNVTDLTRLTPEQLAQFTEQHKVNALLLAVVSQHEQRLRRIEDILRSNGMV